MTTVNDPRDANLVAIFSNAEELDRSPSWLDRVDAWATRAGDAINPILVKETRQALKSRQFVATFGLLLFASLAWTIVGSMLQMPQIYYMPSAPRMLIGYYLVLAVPMLLVVPLAAYRSLESEVDDGTLELLSVTALSPRQIVSGKLASAALQMLLYFIALFPCVAYAYTLRGVDLPTLALLMGMLIVAGLGLTIVALFFAPVTPGRASQISSLLAVLLILIASEFALGSLAIQLIQFGNPLSGNEPLFAILSVLAIGTTAAAILLTATAAKLTPESENRSTGIRIAVLVHQFCVIAVAGFAIAAGRAAHTPPESLIFIPMVLSTYLVGFWTLVGALMSAESPAMTPRIRRELPGTFLGRLLLTWLTPGPATGLIFSIATFTVAAAATHWMLWQLLEDDATVWVRGVLENHRLVLVLVGCYLMFAFVGVRTIVGMLRWKQPVKVSVGIAAMAVVLLVMTVVPYSIQLHLNDYRPFEYSVWQFTNWIWTIEQAGRDTFEPTVLYLVMTLGLGSFLTHLLLVGQRVLPQRLATPERVQEEYRRMAGLEPIAAEENDPLGLGISSAKP